MPGSRMSSRYVPWPRMKRGSSLRFRRPKPTGRSSAMAMCRLLVLGGPADRRDDVLVARAAADAAGDRGADLLVARVGVRVQQPAARHQHAGGAEAALQGVMLVEALLYRVELALTLERLDRADLMAFAHGREDRARLDRLAVHEDDARAAVGGVAAPVRAGETGVLADVVHEQAARLDVVRDRLAVEGDGHVHESARSVARRRARWVSTPARCRL